MDPEEIRKARSALIQGVALQDRYLALVGENQKAIEALSNASDTQIGELSKSNPEFIRFLGLVVRHSYFLKHLETEIELAELE